ncbi:hypothetical protein ScPMuIL_007987 [Solemya velum]
MPVYRLIYYNSRCRAELSRLALAVGGIKYEDVRVPDDEWPRLKPKMPQACIPVLELTLADLALYDIMTYPIDVFGIKLDEYPRVATHRQTVADVPRVAEYLKNRTKEEVFANTILGPMVKECSGEKRYKLIYFPTRGRAEVTRLVFAVSGIDYEDCRIDRQTEWPKIKPNTPFGHLPVLEVDGEQKAGSLSIARFVAKQAGMMGKTSLEQARIEMIVDALQDALETMVSWFVETEESIKAEKKKKVVEETFPTVVSIMESILTKNTADGGFLVGSSLSLADIALYDSLQHPVDLFDFSLDKYPKTAAHRKMVAETPKIAEWLKKRPKTDH